MKKQLIIALATGLISSAGFANEDQQVAQAQQEIANNMLVPVALDKQAEMAAQMRLDDAMDRLNEELDRHLSQDMEAKVDKTIASAD